MQQPTLAGIREHLVEYQCHKRVHAHPMNLGDYNKLQGWDMPEGQDPDTQGYLVVYDAGTPGEYVSWSPADKFDDGYTTLALWLQRPVLMSRDNPNGATLESLLAKLTQELHLKTLNLASDGRPEARQVTFNNTQIIGLLLQAEALQRSSLDTLARLGPDQGPHGTPRAGAGSHDAS